MDTARRELESLLASALLNAEPVWEAHLRHLPPTDGVWIVAFGKADSMAVHARSFLGDHVRGGIVLTPAAKVPHQWPLASYEVDHPWPTERNVLAARAVHELVTQLPRDTLLLCLVSGGGSSHLTLPAPGVDLADLVAVTKALMRAGATIHEINSVRSHCEMLKGGGLAMSCSASNILTLAISDVEGDPPGVIASGPMSPDPSTFEDALRTVSSRGLEGVGPTVTERLKQGMARRIPETPKTDAAIRGRRDGNRLVTDSMTYRVIANNAGLLQSLAARGAVGSPDTCVDGVD